MAKEVRLPQLGQTMEEGTIVNWLVAVGDEVKKGDVIFEVETDKATLEVESPDEGVVKHILVEADQTIAVDSPVMVLGSAEEEVPQGFLDSLGAAGAGGSESVEPASAQAEPEAQTAAGPASKAGAAGGVKASPRAKKAARDLGVDLSAVTGTGPKGRITEADVQKHAATAGAATGAAGAEATFAAGEKIPLTKKQKVLGDKMLASKREIPCFYLNVRPDVTELVELRERLNKPGEVKVSYNDFIIRAAGLALKKFGLMTGRLDADHIVLAEQIGVALAISVGDELVAPVVKSPETQSVRQIAEQSQRLVTQARDNKLTLAELEGACITVSNLGALGVEMFIPIVTPGQCSILGVGGIADTCVPTGRGILTRKLVNLTLSVDHRVVNGAYAARFLDYLAGLLEQPGRLVD